MRTPADIYANELQAQHTIQSADLLEVCRLAKVENIFEKVESFSFEQFFGFTCHLFITTESYDCREQLASILPKFGSIAVFSLLQISHHLNTAETSLMREQHLAKLATQSLQAMPTSALVIGLTQIIEDKENSSNIHLALLETIASKIISLTAHHGEKILLLLSQKLSDDTWNTLQQQLLQALSTLRTQEILNSSTHAVKIKVKKPELEQLEVAC
ncbi:MAG: hypothetical protein AAF810_06545 [Cyanobacteria bacterium P01_D01_bin.36]